MTLNLAALEEAFAPLERAGKGELTFKVGNVDVGIRGMAPEEEVDVHRYAQEAFSAIEDDEEGDNSTTLDYLDRIKYGTLGYAVIQIGTVSFREVEFVDTGEVMDDDAKTPIKIPKHVAVRDLVRKKFSRPVLNGIFRKYGELSSKIAKESEELIEFEPADLDSEIARLEERIADLKAEKERASEPEPNFGDVVRQVAAVDEGGPPPEEPPPNQTEHPEQEQKAESAQKSLPAPSEVPTKQEKVEVPIPKERPPVLPTSAPPPPPKPADNQPLSRGEPLPENFDDVQSSLTDFSGDGLHGAMENEVRRFYAARAAAQAEEERGGPPTQGRVPPHVAAQQPGQLLESSSLEQAEHVGQLHGQDVFRGQPVSLGGAQPAALPPEAHQPIKLDQAKTGSKNPRFQPPKKG